MCIYTQKMFSLIYKLCHISGCTYIIYDHGVKGKLISESLAEYISNLSDKASSQRQRNRETFKEIWKSH